MLCSIPAVYAGFWRTGGDGLLLPASSGPTVVLKWPGRAAGPQGIWKTPAASLEDPHHWCWAPRTRRSRKCGGGDWRRPCWTSAGPNAAGLACARCSVRPCCPLPAREVAKSFSETRTTGFPTPLAPRGSTHLVCSCGDGPSAKGCRRHLGRAPRESGVQPCSCSCCGRPQPSVVRRVFEGAVSFAVLERRCRSRPCRCILLLMAVLVMLLVRP